MRFKGRRRQLLGISPCLVEKSVGFSRKGIQAAGGEWHDVRRLNSVLRRLEKRRTAKIEVEGPFLDSKLAWKAAVLQQVLLYRVTELSGGCSKMWNLGNVLCAILSARALLETIALTLNLETELKKHYLTRDFEGMDGLLTSLTFATRDPELIAKEPQTEAKNILGYIDRLGKKLKVPVRDHYDRLSEWCHPNSYGHFFTFGTLDTDTGTVSLSKQKLRTEAGMLSHITTVYFMLGFVENTMERLDALILDISKAHTATFPIC